MNAVFHPGANVSVIGSDLTQNPGWVPSGDSLNLTSFDNQIRHFCPITIRVLIRVAGKIRPEHMCIKSNGQKNLCLLGVTWFTTYGIMQDLKESRILKSSLRIVGWVLWW